MHISQIFTFFDKSTHPILHFPFASSRTETVPGKAHTSGNESHCLHVSFQNCSTLKASQSCKTPLKTRTSSRWHGAYHFFFCANLCCFPRTRNGTHASDRLAPSRTTSSGIGFTPDVSRILSTFRAFTWAGAAHNASRRNPVWRDDRPRSEAALSTRNWHDVRDTNG